METTINSVADTALWIAAYRAEETKRDDAIFKDKLAEKLAGEKGYKIMMETPHTEAMAFAMVMRTSAIDKLILRAIQEGIDTVINLGAGLDTRPYRMKLPKSLTWIEVDFESIINYKNELLKTDLPVCKLQRVVCDLTNSEERKIALEVLGNGTKKALIITEGVIAYLSNEEAAELSADLHAIPAFEFWIMDYRQGNKRIKAEQEVEGSLKNAPWKFNAENPFIFFKKDGWVPLKNIYILDEADSHNRKVPLKFPHTLLMKLFPKMIHNIANRTYGFVLFKRS
jgi:methyltransferase (TIGR00027 family)